MINTINNFLNKYYGLIMYWLIWVILAIPIRVHLGYWYWFGWWCVGTVILIYWTKYSKALDTKD